MARLPVVGKDDDIWGDILNDFLNVAHNSDGSLKPLPYVSASEKGSANGVATLDVSGKVPSSQLPPAAVTPDATTSSKGIVQLAGDLGGSAVSPTVPGLASKEPTISAGTTSQYWRGDKTWQTLDKISIGLSNVDNTSDANKPVSAATQTALNAKADDAAVIHNSLVDAKGDLIVATGNDTVVRQGIGPDGQILVADSTQAAGLKWAAPSATAPQPAYHPFLTMGS